MGKHSFEQVSSICCECSNISNFQHSTRKKLKLFDIQSGWCPNCLKYTTHFIIKDKLFAYNFLNEKVELTNKEDFILHLIEKNINKEEKSNKSKNL